MTPTLTQGLRLAPPAEKIDQLRYNARLEKAGVPAEAIAEKHISPAVADEFVRGGFAGLLDASATTGRVGVLDPGDVASVKTRTSPMAAVFGFVGVKPEDRADRRAQNAVACADTLRGTLEMGLRGSWVRPLELFAQLDDARVTLDAALKSDTLANMRQPAADALRASLTALHAAMDGRRINIEGEGRIWTIDKRLGDGIENLEANVRRLPRLLGELLDRKPPDFVLTL